MCLGVPECHMFTWYPSLGNLGICFLLKECNDLEVCPYCISGPEAGYDVDTCFDITTTTQTSTTTTTVILRYDNHKLNYDIHFSEYCPLHLHHCA